MAPKLKTYGQQRSFLASTQLPAEEVEEVASQSNDQSQKEASESSDPEDELPVVRTALVRLQRRAGKAPLTSSDNDSDGRSRHSSPGVTVWHSLANARNIAVQWNQKFNQLTQAQAEEEADEELGRHTDSEDDSDDGTPDEPEQDSQDEPVHGSGSTSGEDSDEQDGPSTTHGWNNNAMWAQLTAQNRLAQQAAHTQTQAGQMQLPISSALHAAAELPDYVKLYQRSLEDIVPGESRIETDAISWLAAFNEGYNAYLEAVLVEENVIVDTLVEGKMMICKNILASTDTALLLAIQLKNVALENKTDARVKAALKSVRRGNDVPGIYWQGLVDQTTKESPTPDEIREMLDVMENYCTQGPTYDILASEIESALFPRRKNLLKNQQYGWRRYLKRSSPRRNPRTGITPDPNHTPSPTCELKAKLFIAAVRRRLDKLSPNEQVLPLELPLVEIGYAHNCPNRLKNHKNHTSSNYLMNLMEAVATYLKSRGRFAGRSYRMAQHIIYNLWQPEQGILAEMLFTRIGHGYIYNGGGFSHHPAGLSNESVLTKNKGVEKWNQLMLHAYFKSPLRANLVRNQELVLDLLKLKDNKSKSDLAEALNERAARKDIVRQRFMAERALHPPTKEESEKQERNAEAAFAESYLDHVVKMSKAMTSAAKADIAVEDERVRRETDIDIAQGNVLQPDQDALHHSSQPQEPDLSWTEA
jgi:hypothetical protein